MTPDLASRIRFGFRWNIEHYRPAKSGKLRLIDLDYVHNLAPEQMLNHLGGIAFKGSAPMAAFYMAPYEGNYTPVGTEQASNVVGLTTECTAYDETTRPLWVPGAVAAGACDNTASKGVITLNATKTIYGAYLISSQAKSAGTGVLASLVRFPSPKSGVDDDVILFSAGMAFSN